VDWIVRLEQAESAQNLSTLPAVLRDVLAAILREATNSSLLERDDRLPVSRASREAKNYDTSKVEDFLAHVIDSWVFGQHVYWSLGRGLADARARDKTILRLKVFMEENGWTLAPGVAASSTNAPSATPDRLATALSLLRESGAIT
jgi:hypothetical protein